jgi:hypothetical protein
MGDRVDADDASGARPVFDNERLAKNEAELLRQDASGEIDNAAGLI